MKGETMKQDTELDLKEAFREYAKKELEFYQNAEKDKVYQRVLPNMQDKTKGMIDFFYNGIIVGGYIEIINLRDGRLICLNEEGKLYNLPYNNKATDILRAAFRTNDFIVGDVLVCNDEEIQ